MTLLDPTALNAFEKNVLEKLAQQDQVLKGHSEIISGLLRRVTALEKGDSGNPVPLLQLRYKVTLPSNSQGIYAGTPLELPYAKAVDLQDKDYKVLPNGDIALSCPANGAATTNASYPRSERRYYLFDPASKPRDDGFDTMINMKRGEYVWSVNRGYTIHEIDPKGKVVISQSHGVLPDGGSAPPDYKVMATGAGEVYVLCKTKDDLAEDDLKLDLTEGKTKLVKPGVRFDMPIFFDGNTLKIALNSGKVFTAKFDKPATHWYPKDGCYNAARFPVKITMHVDKG